MTATTAPDATSTLSRRTSQRTISPRKQARMDSATNGAKAFNRLSATCVTLFALVWLVPFAWALITSLRPDSEITADPTRPWSNHWSLDAYRHILDQLPIGWWYLNSFIISTLSVIFTIAICSMLGFALAHTRFRGRTAMVALVLAGVMLPTEALVLPQFAEFRELRLLGTYWALVLPAMAAPIAVLVFYNFLRAIPTSLVEAARIDGAGWWRIYAQVCMPLCRPAISAVAIFTFVSSWNAFLWPLLVLSRTKSQTIPVGLSSLQGGAAIQFAEVMAAAVLGIIPLLAVFLIGQRQIVEGVATTGIK